MRSSGRKRLIVGNGRSDGGLDGGMGDVVDEFALLVKESFASGGYTYSVTEEETSISTASG